MCVGGVHMVWYVCECIWFVYMVWCACMVCVYGVMCVYVCMVCGVCMVYGCSGEEKLKPDGYIRTRHHRP